MQFVKASIKYGDEKPVDGYINVEEALYIDRYSLASTHLRFSNCSAVVEIPFDDFVKKVKGVDWNSKGSGIKVIKQGSQRPNKI